MARTPNALTTWSQYLALRLAVMGMETFSVRRNLATAIGLGNILYRLDRRHRDRALENLAQSMPELAPQRRQALAKASMQHVLQLGVEVIFTPRLIHADTWANHMEITDMTETVDLLLSGRPTILVTPHYGNWEILGYLLALLGLDMAAVARPLDNPQINDWLLGVRQRRGMQILTKWGATEGMVDVLDRGGVLGFIADQNAGDGGIFVPYFGRLASTYKSIGLLAMRFNAPIICGYARRMGDFRFQIGVADVIRPEHWADQPDPLYYVTARYNRAFETIIRQAPEQYLWIHRRWRSRPRHERDGKEMPPSLRSKLEALPWMESSLMERLIQIPTRPLDVRGDGGKN